MRPMSVSKGGFQQQRNAYLSKLATVKPGTAIDALKDDIRRTEKNSKETQQQMVDAGDHILKTKASTIDYNQRID